MSYLTVACAMFYFGYWIRGLADSWKRENTEPGD